MRQRWRRQAGSVLRAEYALSGESLFCVQGPGGEGHGLLDNILYLLLGEERKPLRKPIDPLTIFQFARGLAAAQERREGPPAVARFFVLQ